MATIAASAEQTWLALIVVCSLLWYLSSRSDNSIYSHFQRITGPAILSVWPPPVQDLVAKGYHEVTTKQRKPFVVRWWARDYMIMPPQYLAELKAVDWTALSFFTNISDAFHLHTTVGDLYQSDRMVSVVKKFVNPQLPALTTSIIPAEVDYALEKELGAACDNNDSSAGLDGWTPFPITRTLINVAHRTATSILVSPLSARDEAFVEASSSFVSSIFINALVIVKSPLGIFRNLLAYPISAVLHQRKLNAAIALLQPQVESRIAERDSGVDTSHHRDAIEWTLACSSATTPHENTPRRITEELLYGLWAGSSAPGGLVTDLVFQCLLEPSYLSALRDEASSVVGTLGWTDEAFGALRLLDSFIRETNRLYPTGSVTCSRTVRGQPFRFSDGLTLPAGTRFGFPIKMLQRDPAVLGSGQGKEDPERFDGFRFAKMDELKEKGGSVGERSWAASTVHMTNLAFGYGNHACPGRFYAVREVKLIFTKLILAYDFKWEGNVKERPRPFCVEGQFIPNLSQRVLFKKREKVAKV